MSQTRVPFTMRVSDYSRLEGMLHFDDADAQPHLKIEFYHKESLLNVFGSGLKESIVPLGQLSDVVHKEGWFSDRFVVNFVSLSDAEVIPGTKQGQAILKVSKKDRGSLRSLAVDVELAMTQLRLDQLETR